MRATAIGKSCSVCCCVGCSGEHVKIVAGICRGGVGHVVGV